MSLRITVLEFPGLSGPKAMPPVDFFVDGTIGRSPENQLSLPDDPALSRVHAKIRCVDGQYYFEDTSTNGSLNLLDGSTVHRSSIPVTDGLRIRLGQYVLGFAIHIEDPAIPPITQDDRLSDHPSPLPSSPASQDVLKTSSLGSLPSSSNADALLQLIFQAAEIRDLHSAHAMQGPLIAERIGRLLKSYTEGLRKALEARAMVKDEMKAARTLLGARDNNPLKFISEDSDSLRELLFGDDQSYRSAESAIEEAFDDLIAHEMALFAAIQLSAKQVLQRFNPQEIEATINGGIGFQKKMKCWDSYNESFPHLAESAMDDLLGRTFLAAYEEQLLKIKRSS